MSSRGLSRTKVRELDVAILKIASPPKADRNDQNGFFDDSESTGPAESVVLPMLPVYGFG